MKITHVRKGKQFLWVVENIQYYGIERTIFSYRLFAKYEDAKEYFDTSCQVMIRNFNTYCSNESTIDYVGRSHLRCFSKEFKQDNHGIKTTYEVVLNEKSVCV